MPSLENYFANSSCTDTKGYVTHLSPGENCVMSDDDHYFASGLLFQLIEHSAGSMQVLSLVQVLLVRVLSLLSS